MKKLLDFIMLAFLSLITIGLMLAIVIDMIIKLF